MVTVVQTLKNLLEQASSLLLGKVLLSHDLVKELTTRAQLGDEVDVLFVLEVFVELQYIGVIESL